MATHAADLHHGEEHQHPGERTYIKIAVILALVTIAEVAIYYIDALDNILVPALIVMSVFKFIMVISFFMHLKFDDRRLYYIFAGALLLSISVVGALDVLHRYHAIDYASDFLTGSSGEAAEHE